MKSRKMLKTAGITIIIAAFIFNACSPLREFGRTPAYDGGNNFNYELPEYDSTKKTVIVVTNNSGTELFDMMAPYYLFSSTGKANVYLIAKDKYPVIVKKGIFVLPQLTFNEADSLHIRPDVIVIPFLAAGDSLHQNPVIVNWIKDHYMPDTKILSVCDGAATAAATGIFDGKPITAHASDYQGIRSQFCKPHWIQNTSVANSGNLYSTAGVSNAVEGTLVVIKDLFGPEIMKKVKENIYYPYNLPKIEHQSNTFSSGDKFAIGKKIIFKENKKLGVYLQDGINEFDLAAVMDTYNRTFPKSIESFSKDDQAIKTKFGLTVIPTGKIKKMDLDELHIIDQAPFSEIEKGAPASSALVTYDKPQRQYIIEECLQRIGSQYGKKFEYIVKLMLDYN